MAIVGEKIKDYVIDEINIRQKKLGNTTKNDNDLVYFNAKTAWVKLASGVEISKDKIKELSSNNFLANNINPGKELAEKFVLFGGSSEKQSGNNILSQRQGIGSDFDSYSFNPEFGVIPFPGLKDVSIKCLNRGSLKKAKLKISVSTQHQLEIIDLLYLRLGYTLLLEWGNSHYLDNNEILQSTPTTLIEKEFFNYPLESSFADLLPKVEKLREETNGNYDGFVGKVSNFDWSFNDDGSYDVNLELISLGDVIESLKSNVILDYKTNEFIESTTSGSSNITLTSDNVINNNKTTNTLFSILYLWKEQNAESVDFTDYRQSVPPYKALASQFSPKGATSYTDTNVSFIGDVLSVPTARTLSFNTNEYTVQVQVGYHNQKKNRIHTTLQSDYNYQTEYGFFNYGKPITMTYRFEATSTAGGDLKRIVNDYIVNQSVTGSSFSTAFVSSDGDYTYEDFRYWVGYANVDTNGNSTRDYSANPTSAAGQTPINQQRWDKLVDNVVIKTLNVMLPNDAQAKNRKKWAVTQRKDNPGLGKGSSGNPVTFLSRYDFANKLWDMFAGNITGNGYVMKPGNFSYVLRSGRNGNFGRYSFGNFRWYNRPTSLVNAVSKEEYLTKYKTTNDWEEWPDKPHVDISVVKGVPQSSTTTANPLRKFRWLDLCRLYTKDSDSNSTFSYYMRFGALLQVLKNEILSKVKTTGKYDDYPSIIDINNEMDPFSSKFVSYMQNKPNLTSFDISKCIHSSKIIIPSSGSSDEISLKSFNNDNVGTSLRKWEINENSANSMNIYLNFEFIGNVLESNTDKEGSISVYSFIKGLCDGINKSFANVNNLEPVVDETTNVLSIVDSSNNRATGGTSYELNPFGFIKNNTEGSFIRKVDLKTAITPQYATMVTVGATAGGYVKGVEATAFARWNSGVVDRFNTELLPASEDADIKSSQASIQDSFNNFFRIFTVNKENALSPFGVDTNLINDLEKINIVDRAGSISINPNTIKKNSEIAAEYFRAYSADQKDGGSIGFIPFNVNLKMDGISGIKIYNEILLNTRFLPSNYSKNLSFITTAVDHTLKSGDWETNLKLTLIPTPRKKPYTVPAKPSYIKTTAAVATGASPSGVSLQGNYSTNNDNNPYNLRPNSGPQFNGYIGKKEGFRKTTSIGFFAVFDIISNGVRAGMKNLSTYFTKRNLKTIKEIINVYAPGGSTGQSQSATNNYIKIVTDKIKNRWATPLGISFDENTILNFKGSNETDPNNIKMFKELNKAILEQEGNVSSVTLTTIDNFDIKKLA